MPPPGVPAGTPPGMPLTSPAAMPARGKRESMGAVICGAGGIAMMLVCAIGSALPWASVSFLGFSHTKNGLSGDGVITIITGLLALAFFVVGLATRARWPFIVALVMTLITAAIGIYDAVDVSGTELASVGIGLWLVLVCGVIGVGLAIGGIASPRKRV